MKGSLVTAPSTCLRSTAAIMLGTGTSTNLTFLESPPSASIAAWALICDKLLKALTAIVLPSKSAPVRICESPRTTSPVGSVSSVGSPALPCATITIGMPLLIATSALSGSVAVAAIWPLSSSGNACEPDATPCGTTVSPRSAK